MLPSWGLFHKPWSHEDPVIKQPVSAVSTNEWCYVMVSPPHDFLISRLGSGA